MSPEDLPSQEPTASPSEDTTVTGPPHSDTHAHPLPPIGHYVLREKIGEGGFGEVYLAEQIEPIKRRVALKVLKAGMDTKAVLARFEAERQALALMDHPNIAKVYDAGATDHGLPYFVMELVKGEPITAYSDRHKLSIRERLDLFIPVCHAVQHAHQKGIIHRDLKPSNILVMVSDEKPLPKVIDFGIAKATAVALTEKTLYTVQGQLIGTPEYMSPEQAEMGGLDVDTRTDIYSLGAVLYELLTGGAPFDAQTLRAGGIARIQQMIREEEPKRPSTKVSTLGEKSTDAARARRTDAVRLSRLLKGDLDWIVLRAMEKDRTRRYETANTLALDIRHYLNDEPVLAGPPSAVYRMRKFVKRHRVGLAFGAVVFASVLLVAIESNRQRAAAQKAREESEAVTGFLSEMLAAVDPGKQGREVTVREVLDRAARTIGEEFGAQPLVRARLRHTIGNTYSALGLLDEADRHLEAALEILRRNLGEEHPSTLTAVGNLGGLRFHQGRFAESEALCRRALKGYRKAGKPDDRQVLGIMNNLAQACFRQGRFAEAAALQADVLQGQHRVEGPDHPSTLGAAVNLALIKESLGQMAAAESLYVQALDGWKRAHGAEHPGTLLATSGLAALYVSVGRPADAESLYRSVLNVRSRILGERHPETIASMSNLGSALRAHGRADEAEEYFSRAWDLSRGVLGADHPNTLQIATNLTSIYESKGWPEATRHRVAVILTSMRTFVGRADASASALNDCAWLLLTVKPAELRDPAMALQAASRACGQERASGGGRLWEYLDTLALAQYRTGDPTAALVSQKEAIKLIPPTMERYRDQMQQRAQEYEQATRQGASK